MTAPTDPNSLRARLLAPDGTRPGGTRRGDVRREFPRDIWLDWRE